ncbi:hypothetical protein Tco_1076635 [Tanacetum coccineum]
MSSDEASSRVTYTSRSSDYEEPSDAGPEYPEYLTPSDDEIPVEDQTYATATSPISLSSGYIDDSGPEEDPKDESEDGPTDHPADGGDDNDDDLSGDDADDEEEAFKEDDDDEEDSEEDDDDEEEEEHLAPTEFTAVSPAVDHVPFAEEIEPFETDKSAATPPPPPPLAYQVDRLLAIPTPPPSPLTPLLSPLSQIPSPPFPVPSPPTTSPTYAEAPLGFRADEIQLRAASPLPSPTSPPTTITITTITTTSEGSSTATAAKQPSLGATHTTVYGFVDLVDNAPRSHVPREVGYGITDTWDELVDAIKEGAPTTLEGVNARVTKLAETHERDTQDLYAHLEDAQDSQAHLSDRVDILLEDRQFHHQTVMLIED